MKETEQTLLDKIKNDVAKELGAQDWIDLMDRYPEQTHNAWTGVCERYATEKSKAESPAKDQLQQIETEYQNRIMNTLMDKWGLSVQNARDIGRDLFYTYVFPVYELGGQFGFKAGYTRSQVQASCEATLKRVLENLEFDEVVHPPNNDREIVVRKESVLNPSNIVIL